MSARPRTGSGGSGDPQTSDPALALLRGGALPALAMGVVLAVVGLFAGGRAVAGAGVGTIVVCLAMSAGPLVMRGTRRSSPPAVMAISLLTYGVVVSVLGVVYLALERVAWLSAGHLGVTLIACAAAWTAGELWAAWHLRVLAFGDPGDVADRPSASRDGGSSVPGQTGSAGPGAPKTH